LIHLGRGHFSVERGDQGQGVNVTPRCNQADRGDGWDGSRGRWKLGVLIHWTFFGSSKILRHFFSIKTSPASWFYHLQCWLKTQDSFVVAFRQLPSKEEIGATSKDWGGAALEGQTIPLELQLHMGVSPQNTPK